MLQEEVTGAEAQRVYEEALQEFADWVDTSGRLLCIDRTFNIHCLSDSLYVQTASTSTTNKKTSPTISPTTSPSSSKTASNSASKVLVGQVLRGRLQLHATLNLGPTSQGHFVPVYISSLRLHNVNVQYVVAGQTATFRLSRLSTTTSTARTAQNNANATTTTTAVNTSSNNCQKRSRCNGLVLLSTNHLNSVSSTTITTTNAHCANAACCWEFVASLTPSSSSSSTSSVVASKTVLRTGCEVVAHIHGIRQSVRVLAIHKHDHLSQEQQARQEAEREGEELCAGESGLVR